MLELFKALQDRLALENPWTLRHIAAALLLAIGAQLFELSLHPSAGISLLPAIIMAVALLGGWRWAAALALTTLFVALLLDNASGTTALGLPFAVASGEALRRSMGCFPALIMQLLAKLILYLQALANGLAAKPWEATGMALTEATFNVALSIGCVALLPRRATSHARRARIGTGHLIFMLIAGSAALTTIGLLQTLPAQTLSDEIWLRVCALLALAIVIAYLATLHAQTRLRGIQRWLQGDAPSPPQLLCPELEKDALGVMRETRRLRRDLVNRSQQLDSAEKTIEQLKKMLQTSKGMLKQRLLRLRQTEHALGVFRNRYRVLMRHSSDVAMFVTPDGTIESASRSILTLLGYDAAAVKGQRLSVLVPAHQSVEHPLSNLSAENVTASLHPFETILRSADGKEIAAHIQICQYTQANGHRFAIHVRDPSGTRAAITALRRAQKMTKEARRSRELFIAAMSHELRTPLHGLLATLEMMRTEPQSAQELQQRLSVARLSARSLLKIANDILDLTRIDSGHFPLQHELFSLGRLLQELIDASRAQADSLHLSLTMQLPEWLPRSFHGDPVRLKQIMNNLISNALKCTRRGGVHLNVEYDAQRITIDVIDSGEGVPADKRESIFDPFIQVDKTRASRGGTGLGLPISRRLARAMGGDVILLRSSETGSVFRVTLALEASHESPRDEQTQRIFRNPRGRILVVEDNSTNRFVAEALLASLNCPATIVDNGAEAVQLLGEQHFDLVLMDCQMPEMDGYETTRRIRAQLHHRVPVIAMTASTMADDRPRCLAAGMDDFLPKPFGRAALHDILCKWLRPDRQGAATPNDPIAALPDLDQRAFDELSHSLRHERAPLQRICEAFVDSADQILLLLKNGQIDAASVKIYLHSLLGSAGMVGARRVEYLAGQLQAFVADGNQAATAHAVDALVQSMQRFRDEFNRSIEKHLQPGTVKAAQRGTYLPS